MDNSAGRVLGAGGLWLSAALTGNALAATLYWDSDGATPGAAASATASGTWGASAFWSTDPAGAAATGAYVAASDVVFSAGSDATGTFTISSSGTPSARSITIEEGTITFSGGVELADTGVGLIDIATGRATTFTGVLGGSVGVTKAGAGTLQLNTASTVTGGIRIQGGIIQVGVANALASSNVVTLGSAAGSGLLTLNFPASPRTLTVAGLATTGQGGSVVNGNSSQSTLTLHVAAGESPDFDGNIGGSGTNPNLMALTKTGPGTQQLGGTNTYTGETIVSDGVLRYNAASAVAPARITVHGGGVIGIGADLNGATADDFTRALGTSTGQVRLTTDSGAGNASAGFAAYGADRTVNLGGSATPTTLTWNSTNNFLRTTSTALSNSTFILSAPDADATLIFRNPILLNGQQRPVDVRDGSADVDAELAGALGGGGLTKLGAGTLELSAANTYSGQTQVHEGRLLVTGSLVSSSTVVVAAGATLGGTGVIHGPVNSSGGTIAPGLSSGTLTINNALTLDDDSILAFELHGGNHTVGGGVNDLITGVTHLTLAGTLHVTAAATFLDAQLGDSWRLVNYSGTLTDLGLTLGLLPALSPHLAFALDTQTSGEVNLVIIPEPGLLSAWVAAGLLMLRRDTGRRRA